MQFDVRPRFDKSTETYAIRANGHSILITHVNCCTAANCSCISPSPSYNSQTAPSTVAYSQALTQNYHFSAPSFSISYSSSRISPKPAAISCRSTATPLTLLTGNIERSESDRSTIRLGLPSKGRLGTGTLDLLTNCQLSIRQLNPEQYVADIPEISNLEVWFQRPKDIVRRLLSGEVDIGIVGFDTFCEYGQGDEDLIIVHDALEYGHCRLSMAVPRYGIFENINSISKLAKMPQWTSEKPLRVATGYTYMVHMDYEVNLYSLSARLSSKFLKEKGLKHVTFSTADGALEAAPVMGTADAIIDILSTGTTLRENNLKEIEGGVVLESQAVLVARKKSIIQQNGALDTTREILERLEAHLRALDQSMVTANMRGSSLEEVSERILSQPQLSGLQGPTVNEIFSKPDSVTPDYYEIVICVPKRALYKSVQQLRAIGGSGVLISPLAYIFDEEPPRWHNLVMQLGL